jgi:hypothetical protein
MEYKYTNICNDIFEKMHTTKRSLSAINTGKRRYEKEQTFNDLPCLDTKSTASESFPGKNNTNEQVTFDTTAVYYHSTNLVSQSFPSSGIKRQSCGDHDGDVPQSKEANQFFFVNVHQHGGDYVTC